MEQLFNNHTEFTLKTFPEATIFSSLIKLEDELVEVKNDLSEGKHDSVVEEYVDCVMCLFDSAARAGITGKEFEAAFRKKLAKNKNRAWVKNPDNTYSHVKQNPTA